jgi:DNA-directed RNA polymerase subunit RPC12/RpoP
MSKRKDRERFTALKESNPYYQGFRGQGADIAGPSPEALTTLNCTVCGRRRNVTQEIARTEGDSYVCLSCREDAEAEVVTSEEAPETAPAV